MQSLLQILIDVLDALPHTVAFEDPGFTKAEHIFAMSGWQVRHFNTENLHNKLPQLLYVSPSNPYKGRSLSPQGRLDLLRWAQQNSAYILEDDYNGEFRYFSHPISSLQGMSGGQNVIYCGSFSRIRKTCCPFITVSSICITKLPPALSSLPWRNLLPPAGCAAT